MIKRSFPRVRLNTDATIVARGACYRGMLENISLTGVFVRTKLPVDVGDTADITLPLPTASLHTPIEFKGTVVRIEEDGMACQILNIDHTTFAHLKSILKNKNVRKLAA